MNKHRPGLLNTGPSKFHDYRDRSSSLSCQACRLAPPYIIIIDLVALALLSVPNAQSLTLSAQNGESVLVWLLLFIRRLS